jgi:4-amino-4-deoxy-L-arabinose transferase-like glycosyltransferase
MAPIHAPDVSSAPPQIPTYGGTRPYASRGSYATPESSARTIIPRTHLAVLALLSLALLLLGLRPRELWGTDEAIVGTIIREMVVDGQWLVPHVNGQVYPDKPPLYYWLAALPAALSGTLTPLWFRLPATLAAIGCLWLTYALGARLMSRTTGLVAAVVLATSPLFAVSAQIARMDMLLTLLITVILYCFARGLQEPARQRRWFLAMYPLAGLAFLTKGLIGPVVAGFVIGSVLLWQRDWRLLLRLQPAWGVLLAGAVILPWLIPAVMQEGLEYADELIVTQSVGRAVRSFAHDRPFYYYLYAFPPAFLPWALFLPGALTRLWQRWGGPDWRLPLLLSWTAGLFLFFSAIGGKLLIYMLPLLPAAALVVADLFGAALATPDASFSRRWLFWPTVLAVAALVGASVALPATGLLPDRISNVLLLGYAGAVAFVSFVIVRMTTLSLARRCFAMVLLPTVLAFALANAVIGAMSGTFSPRPLGDLLLRYREPAPVMATYRVRHGWLNYYAERRFDILATPRAVREFLAQAAPAICVIKNEDLARVWKTLPEELRVIERRDVGGAIYLIIANRYVPGAT